MRHFFTFLLVLVTLQAPLDGSCTEIIAGPQSPVNPAVTARRSNPKVVLYSTSWCPHCREAKEYLKKNNIAYTNRDVEDDADAMEALVEKYKSRAVPVIVIGDDEKILKGFHQDEFEKAYGEIKKVK